MIVEPAGEHVTSNVFGSRAGCEHRGSVGVPEQPSETTINPRAHRVRLRMLQLSDGRRVFFHHDSLALAASKKQGSRRVAQAGMHPLARPGCVYLAEKLPTWRRSIVNVCCVSNAAARVHAELYGPVLKFLPQHDEARIVGDDANPVTVLTGLVGGNCS